MSKKGKEIENLLSDIAIDMYKNNKKLKSLLEKLKNKKNGK